MDVFKRQENSGENANGSALKRVAVCCVVLVLVVWLLMQGWSVLLTTRLPWGNFVDHAVYLSRTRGIFPLAWASIKYFGKKRYGVTLNAHLLHPLAISVPKSAACTLCQWDDSDLKEIEYTQAFANDLLLQRIGPPPAIPEDACVLHLRLGDVPFVRHSVYRMPTFACLRAALAAAEQARVDAGEPPYASTHILCTTKHAARPAWAAASMRLAKAIAAELGIGLVANRPEIDDLRTLRDARTRITLTSSFAFYPALASPFRWINVHKRSMRALRDNIIDVPVQDVPHAAVKNYLDLDKLLGLMRGL